MTYIRTFANAGLLLLFFVIFNFPNLYVNRMMQRNREIKLQKTVGAGNFSIINQLQLELAIQLVFVFAVSSLLLKLAMPIFKQRFETQIIACQLGGYFAIISLIGFAIIAIACLLAEIRFARFSSLTQTASTFNNLLFRTSNICIQLAICIFFLLSATVIYRQSRAECFSR